MEPLKASKYAAQRFRESIYRVLEESKYPIFQKMTEINCERTGT